MQMFSINAASLLLEKDRRTVTKAMLGVAPDAKVKGQARWKLPTIIAALAAHERPDGHGNAQQLALIGDIEAAFASFDAGLARLAAEPDIERRRALETKLKIGPMIGHMDRLLQAANAAHPEGDRVLPSLATDEILRQSIGKLYALLEWSTVFDAA